MKDGTRRGPQNRVRDDGPMTQALVSYSATPFINDELEDLNTNYLRTYWHAVRQNIELIAGITLFATLAVAVYEFRQLDQYEAQSRIEIGQAGETRIRRRPE